MFSVLITFKRTDFKQNPVYFLCRSMTPTGIFAGICLFVAVYCAVDPFNHSAISGLPNFETLKVDVPAWGDIPVEKDLENLLQKSDIKFLKPVQGPESVAFDQKGWGPYTGVADGRILFWDGKKWTDFAYTSANRSSGLCDPKPTTLSYMKDEHICGRPLGLRFDKRTGDLYIADAYFGLMKVGPEGGLATSLTNEAEGVPLRFTNDLDIADDGSIYFTDSSTKYQRRMFLFIGFSGDSTGRLLKYDPTTKETSVLVRNLQFPNGVSLSKDGSFFVFCEGAPGKLRKYWLKGKKVGTSEIFAILPGYPDNVRTNENGDFWVAVNCRKTLYGHLFAKYPTVRKLLLKLPVSSKFHGLLQIGGNIHGVAMKYSPEGKFLRILEDRQGKVVKALSEVEEKEGKLWMGSVLMPFMAVYQLD